MKQGQSEIGIILRNWIFKSTIVFLNFQLHKALCLYYQNTKTMFPMSLFHIDVALLLSNLSDLRLIDLFHWLMEKSKYHALSIPLRVRKHSK
jgi:hypothetical protein